MPDSLDLSLPKPDAPSGGVPRVPLLLGLLIAIGLANLYLAARSPRPAGTAQGALSADAAQQLALEMEKRDLFVPATDAWQEYLATAAILGPEEQARVWYRMGTLFQQADEFERAAAAFLRSESLAELDEVTMDLRRRTQQCLEALGSHGALQRDLAERVGGGTDDSAVVAEIGQRKITAADLDRLIEEDTDRQISQFTSAATPEEHRKAKEEHLKRYTSPQERMQFLASYISQELLTRRARESGLANAPEIRKLLAAVERSILAQRVLEQEFAANIRITETDVKTFYEANRKKFVRPARARISVILVKDEKDAADVLAKLEGGAEFAELAKTLSLDAGTKAQGGDVQSWAYEGRPLPGVQDSAAAYAAIFAAEPGKVVPKPLKTTKGFLIVRVREKEAAKPLSFDEAKNQAARALHGRKRQEIQAALFRQLHEQYKVIVHQSQFQGTKPDDAKK